MRTPGGVRSGGPAATAVLLAFVASIVLLLVPAASPAASRSHRSAPGCARGSRVGALCVAPGAACNASQRHLYTELGLACVRRRLRRGGLAVQRGDEEYAVAPDGRVGMAEAEQAFLAAGGRIPGVKPVPGAVALPADADLTGPRTLILGYLTRLRPAQRRAVERFLAGGAHAAVVSKTFVTEEEPIIIAFLTKATGFTLPFEPEVVEETRDELDLHTKTADVVGYAEPIYNSAGVDKGCHVGILDTEVSEDISEVVNTESHELTHCFQEAAAGTLAQFAKLPAFFLEGYAEWAGDEAELELVGVDRNDGQNRLWFKDPHIDLFTRSYDAFPLYDDVAEDAGGGFSQAAVVWRSLVALSRAGGAAAIYAQLKAIAGSSFEQDLATYPLLDRKLGPEWVFEGAGLRGQPSPPDEDRTLDNGDSLVVAAPVRASDRYVVDVQADITVVEGQAPGRLHLSDGRNLDVEPMKLCDLQEGCQCPDGSNPATEGGQMGQATIAIWGQMSGNKVTLTGESKQEACGEKASSSSPQGAGGEAGVTLTKPPATKPFLTLARQATCSDTGGTLRITLTPLGGGGQKMLITLPGYQQGVAHVFKLNEPANGGPVASYSNFTTDINLEEEGEIPNAGGAISYNGQKFFSAATLFAAGAGDGVFATGPFTC